jgi:hypothetical protein
MGMTITKFRFVVLEGTSVTRIQWRSWYWPFWTFISQVNEGGGISPMQWNDPREASKWFEANVLQPKKWIPL